LLPERRGALGVPGVHVRGAADLHSGYPRGARAPQIYNERTMQFMKNVIRISGIGDPQGFLPDGAAPAPRPPH